MQFQKCERCKREISSMKDQRSTQDKMGFTHIFCKDCFGDTNRPDEIVILK
jgi:hypothetical protein